MLLWIRNLLGVLAGVAVAALITKVVAAVSGYFLMPTLGPGAAAALGVGPSLAATLTALGGAALGTFTGATVAVRVSGRASLLHAPPVVGLLVIAALAGNFGSGHPFWFWPVSITGLLAAAYTAAKLAPGPTAERLHLPVPLESPVPPEPPVIEEPEGPMELAVVQESVRVDKEPPVPSPTAEEAGPMTVARVVVPESFTLLLKDGVLKLPAVRLVPIEPGNVPLAPSVSFWVTGSAGTETFARAVRQAYVDEAEQFRPKALTKPHNLEPTGLKTDEVLPPGSELTLRARLTYQVMGPGGVAAPATPVEATCRLQPGDDVTVWREIMLEPRVMVLSQGTQEECSVKIKVRSLGDPTRRGVASGAVGRLPSPRLRITRQSMEAIRALPELLAHLKRASESIRDLPPVAGPESADGVHEYLLSTRLNVSGQERKILADLTHERSLMLALTVHASGALPAPLTVEVESVAGQFPGQFAVDFGTSNSTITIYEPKEITPRPLPIDQLEELRSQFARWLAKPPDKVLEGVSESSIEEFVASVTRNLTPGPGELPLETLRRRFRPEVSEKAIEGMHEAIRQIELSTSRQDDPKLRRALRVKLHDIYAEAFRAFPFRQYNLTTLPLEDATLDMSSELEIVSTQQNVTARMGSDVREAREAFEMTGSARNGAAVSSTPNPDGEDPIVEGRFHRVPKRYLSQLNREHQDTVRVVRESGVRERLDYAQILGAAWDHLRGRFDDVRERSPNVYSRGRVRRAVVTYPTVLGPRARNEVVKLFRDMGVPTVRMIYDEAIAAAIFHLEKFFGGSYEVGPEAFKTRCRRQGEVWVQNMLVLDIGGGTTDLAMIRLQMQQEPFKGADQGAGGRYYTITPTLLGSSGNEFLGGELITLRTFRLLKLAIADYVLRHDSAMIYPSDLGTARKAAIAKLDARQSYQPGTLLQLISAPKDDPNFKVALEAAEDVLPTRFKYKPAARVAFQALWREAEKIKLALGRRRKARPGMPDLPLQYSLDPSAVAALLSTAWKGANGALNANAGAPPLMLDSEMFERVAGPVVEQALRIAVGLSESTLRKYEADHPRSDGAPPEKLDRIVLSGKSCNLQLVHALLPQTMRKCTYYGDEVTEILFEDNLAKQATSVGACRAEEMWASLRLPEGWEAISRTGVSSIAFDIRNLFFFLPCSFWLKDQAEQLTVKIFTVNERFRMIDGSSMGKIRSSDWTAPQPITRVYRIDYDGDPGINWGNYPLDSLARTLGRSPQELQEDLRIHFEVDHETLIKILFCKQGLPKYTFNDRAVVVGQANVRPKLLQAMTFAAKPATGDPLQGRELRFDIAIDPDPVHGNPTIIMEAGTPFEHEAMEALPPQEVESSAPRPSRVKAPVQGEDGAEGVMFALSGPLPKPRSNRTYEFYARAASGTGGKWIHLGAARLPREMAGFEENWHAAIALDGYIRVMQGCPDYWKARTPQDLYDHKGTVLYQDLEIEVREAEPDMNPDSGIH